MPQQGGPLKGTCYSPQISNKVARWSRLEGQDCLSLRNMRLTKVFLAAC